MARIADARAATGERLRQEVKRRMPQCEATLTAQPNGAITREGDAGHCAGQAFLQQAGERIEYTRRVAEKQSDEHAPQAVHTAERLHAARKSTAQESMDGFWHT